MVWRLDKVYNIECNLIMEKGLGPVLHTAPTLSYIYKVVCVEKKALYRRALAGAVEVGKCKQEEKAVVG